MTEFYQEFLVKKLNYIYYLMVLFPSLIAFITTNNIFDALLTALVLLLIFYLADKYLSYEKIIIEYKENELSINYVYLNRVKEYHIDLSEITRYEEKIVKYNRMYDGYIIFHKLDNSEIKIGYLSESDNEARNAIVDILNKYNNIEKRLSF